MRRADFLGQVIYLLREERPIAWLPRNADITLSRGPEAHQ